MNYSRKGVRAKKKALNAKSQKIGRKVALLTLKLFLVAIVGVSVILASAGIGMFKGILASTPQITPSDVAPVGAATFVYDCEGNKLDELIAVNSNRIIVTQDKIPEHLALAFVAIEDARYYQHNGIDYKAMLRSGYQFIKTMGKETQGASTITQQLLKNTIFTTWTSEGDNMIKKIKRKLQEQYLAIELTKILSKDEMLVRYLNTINLGQNTLGVEAASQRYFGKSCSELTLSESAVIAAITQNPSRYNPIRHPEENLKRRTRCLNDMLAYGFIDQAAYDEAIADNVYDRIESHNIDYIATNSSSSYFVDAVQRQVREDLLAAGYDETRADFLLYSGGLRIMTAMDPKIQAIADAEVANPDNYPPNVKWLLDYALTIKHADGSHDNYSKEMMTKYFKENIDKNFNLIFTSQEAALEAIEQYRNALMKEGDDYDENYHLTPQPQTALAVIEQETGYVRALVGGRGAKEGRLTFNRATDAMRQPGSCFKILAAYAPALDSYGITLANVYIDSPFNYADGTPVHNWYGETYKGPVTVRYAIEQSMNIIAVKTITQITPKLSYEYLLNFGFSTLTTDKIVGNQRKGDMNQSTALGGLTDGVTPLELTAAYATIANGGVYNKPKLYTQVLDAEGNVILDNTGFENSHRVLQESTAFLLTEAMVDVVTKGTGTSTNFNREMAIAGKTGTTSNYVDVWFAGYTPYYTCATWVGYDNNVHMNSKRGENNESNIAKIIWRNVMEQIHANLQNQAFYVPTDGVVQYTVCKDSGKLPNPGVCPETSLHSEYFAVGTVPLEMCDVHYSGLICEYDQLPASAECPFPYTGVTTRLPAEDPSLEQGSTIAIPQPDGSVIYSNPNVQNTCQHNAAFFLNPDYQTILTQQEIEIELRRQQHQQMLLQQQLGMLPNADG
ncbi:MAG: transglycosylase domain-containing protein [bacterium]|nr:transglycosylase domain-containing protein [bacterium]MCM1374271.1 transglycosylase domain-containing protein [Muribaculum sp.]